MKRQIPYNIICSFVFLIIIVGAVWCEHFLVLRPNMPQLPDGVTPEDWSSLYLAWAYWVLSFALFASILWYCIAKFGIKVSNLHVAKWWWWGIFLILLAGSGVAAYIFIMQNRGGAFVYLFFIFNGGIFYYVSTLLCSPEAFRFIPLLAPLFVRR